MFNFKHIKRISNYFVNWTKPCEKTLDMAYISCNYRNNTSLGRRLTNFLLGLFTRSGPDDRLTWTFSDREQLGLSPRVWDCRVYRSTSLVSASAQSCAHIFHYDYSVLHLPMQKSDPLVGCHRSSRTHLQPPPVFCKDQAMHHKMSPFVSSLSVQE